MRVIVSGATGWGDVEVVRRELAALPPETIIIHGDARGADEIGGQIARELGFSVERLSKNEGDYRRYKRGAWKGLNERMLASGVDLVLAFHEDIDRSHGTRHLVRLAREAGVPVQIITG